jgi:histone H3/H4
MKKRENILPLLSLGDIIAEASGKRVSEDARKEAEKILEELTQKIVSKANLLAQNSNRKTIKAKDVNLAYMQISNKF